MLPRAVEMLFCFECLEVISHRALKMHLRTTAGQRIRVWSGLPVAPERESWFWLVLHDLPGLTASATESEASELCCHTCPSNSISFAPPACCSRLPCKSSSAPAGFQTVAELPLAGRTPVTAPGSHLPHLAPLEEDVCIHQGNSAECMLQLYHWLAL